MDLQELLEIDVDVVTEREMRPRIAQRVLADAVAFSSKQLPIRCALSTD